MDTASMTQTAIKAYLEAASREDKLALIEQLTKDSRKSVQQLAERTVKQLIKAEK